MPCMLSHVDDHEEPYRPLPYPRKVKKLKRPLTRELSTARITGPGGRPGTFS
jgi:hypothetical protein